MKRMMKNSFLSEEELKKIGFKSLGDNVCISRFAQFYSPEKMEIGSNVRIDDFCLLSGKIVLKDYIHISAYVALYGGDAGIYLEDFSGISAKSIIYAVSDDFSGGEYLANATVPLENRNVTEKSVALGRYVQIGAGTIILPGVVVEEGACTGSMTLVNKSLKEWGIYVGIPCNFFRERKKISDETYNNIKNKVVL